jgi:hypothetical protein
MRNQRPLMDPSYVVGASFFRKAAAYNFGLVPATGTKDPKTGVPKPLFGGSAFKVNEGSLALAAPSIRTGCVCIIAPKEANPVTAIDREGYVLTDEPDALSAMQPAVDAGPMVRHGAKL